MHKVTDEQILELLLTKAHSEHVFLTYEHDNGNVQRRCTLCEALSAPFPIMTRVSTGLNPQEQAHVNAHVRDARLQLAETLRVGICPLEFNVTVSGTFPSGAPVRCVS